MTMTMTTTVPVPDTMGSGYRLTAGQAQAVRALAAELGVLGNNDPDEFCARARLLARRLPLELTETMLRFGERGSDTGMFVVSGLDVGTVPATPLHNRDGVGASTPFASQLILVAHLLGDIVYYEAEGTGHLVQDVVPNPQYLHRQSSQGSRAELEAHTEQSFSPMRPDYVVLGCLQGDPAAHTFVLPVSDLVRHFSEAELAYLRRPLWTTLIDDSFHPYVPDPEEVRGPFPLLSGSPEDPVLLLDQELTHGMTAQAQQLLQRVIAVYSQAKKRFTLSAGDIGFVDNTRAMHGRSAFAPRFDGRDRFLLRTFVVRDLRRTSAARTPGHRMIGASAS
jgi:L-asparagine oxygenase